MEMIRLATEALIRLLKTEVDPGAVLIAADDVFAATDVSALLLQGPTLTEDTRRRTLAHWAQRDQHTMTFTGGPYPRLYHLDFDVVVSTGTEQELLVMNGLMTILYQRHPVLMIPNIGALPMTELTPLGTLRRVNLSNLRQATGRLRIEDCPIGDDIQLQTETGRLIGAVAIDLALGGHA